MSNLLYAFMLMIIAVWIVGFFGYHAGGLIHLLLVIAVVMLIINLSQWRKS